MQRLGVLAASDIDEIGPRLAEILAHPAKQRLQVFGVGMDGQNLLRRVEPRVEFCQRIVDRIAPRSSLVVTLHRRRARLPGDDADRAARFRLIVSLDRYDLHP